MLKAGRLVALLMALYMAFALVWSAARFPYMGVDQEVYGLGARPASLVGQAWPATKMDEWAKKFNVDVLVAGTPKRPGVIAGYPAPSDSEFSEWLKNGYPCLNACVAKPLNLRTDPAAIRDFETNVSGLYFMGKNSEEAAAAASRYFSDLGWKTTFDAQDSWQNWWTLFRTLFGRLLVITCVIVLLLTAGSVLTRTHATGIHLLQGTSRLQLTIVGLLNWVKFMGTGGLVGIAALYLMFLSAFKGHQFDRVILTFMPLFAALVGVGALGIVVANMIVRLSSILGMVKGDVKFGATLPIVYIVRSILILAMVSLLVALGSSLETYSVARSVRGHLGPMESLSLVGFNGGSGDSPRHQKLAVPEVARLLANEKLILSVGKPAYYYDTTGQLSDHLAQGQQSLVIEANPAFLERNPPEMHNGRPFDARTDIASDNVTLIVPEGADPVVAANVERYMSGLFRDGEIGTISGMNISKPAHVLAVKRSEHSYPTNWNGISLAKNPVIIVYPRSFKPSQDFVTSQAGFFIKPGEEASILASAPNFASLINEPQPVTKVVEESIEQAGTAVSRGLVELLGLLLALPLCTLSATFLYARQNSRRIFIQTMSGRRLGEIAPLLVVLDLVTAVSVAWYLRPKGPALEDLHAYGKLALWAPKIQFAIALAVLSLVIVLQYLILRRLQWGIVRRHASEA